MIYREKRFSERFGFNKINQVEITVRQDAPTKLRSVLTMIAEEAGLSPKPMRELVCRVLREAPDSYNWSEYPNIKLEVDQLLQNCEWYKVYDVIEEICTELYRKSNFEQLEHFVNEMNKFFHENGIGWKIVNGSIEARGSEAFEVVLEEVIESLDNSGRKTTKNEIHEAIKDLSRRPEPDLTGAIQHAMAALECLSRDVIGTKDTLGKLIKSNPDIFPKPLDQAIEKIWGYASNTGRHLIEDANPDHEEAELIVGLVSVLGTYLNKKFNEER